MNKELRFFDLFLPLLIASAICGPIAIFTLGFEYLATGLLAGFLIGCKIAWYMPYFKHYKPISQIVNILGHLLFTTFMAFLSYVFIKNGQPIISWVGYAFAFLVMLFGWNKDIKSFNKHRESNTEQPQKHL